MTFEDINERLEYHLNEYKRVGHECADADVELDDLEYKLKATSGAIAEVLSKEIPATIAVKTCTSKEEAIKVHNEKKEARRKHRHASHELNYQDKALKYYFSRHMQLMSELKASR